MNPHPSATQILSRHRLPRPYRVGLTVMWLTPIGIFTLSLLLRHGVALVDVRLFALFALMALPAVYVWREGIDVLSHGIIRRVHIPQYFPYQTLDNWYFDPRTTHRTLTVWDARNRKVVEIRAGHLTGMPVLLRALKDNVRGRNWPY